MTFLFDIGRVILDFEFDSRLLALFPAGCDDAPARIQTLMARKDDFEAGRISVDEFVDWALGVVGCGISREEFLHAWRWIFTPNPPMWESIQRLSDAGHRLLLFSNTSGIHCPWALEHYPVFSKFHGAILSFETGFVKPDPEIFHHAVRTHQLIPAQTAYIDDLPGNIATGLQFGFHCWLYDLANHAAYEDWLTTLPGYAG